ncbi:MAG: DEAD/DEAH box helicase, partial [Chloroflexota bacterium]
MGAMPVVDVLTSLRMNRDFMAQVIAWERIPARPAISEPLPGYMSAHLVRALQSREIQQLYRHQALAINAAAAGDNVVVSTATASGKSLCYTIPVLERLLVEPAARALYLFPTKALAHDQLSETNTLIAAADMPIEVQSYDGDTPQSQ